MRDMIIGLLVVGLTAPLVERAGAAVEGTNSPAANERIRALAPPLLVAVDPRVELVSLLFRLAGNPEYNQGKVESYLADVERQFVKFGEHTAVKLSQRQRETRGVSFDACMSLAVLLTGVREPALKVPLAPWPESLDKRWNAKSVVEFLAATKQFVQDTAFQKFVEKHRTLYQTTEERLRELMDKEGHLEWFYNYFGERPGASFTLVPALLNGGSCYGPHARDAAGNDELFCILGVWGTDSQGLPAFRKNVVDAVVHEFNHSYANPIIDRHFKDMEASGQKLFRQVAAQMRLQAYGDASTMLRESLVRACVVRYLRHFEGAAAEQAAIQKEKGRGFLWIKELSDLLGDYEAARQQYLTLESFAPRMVAFFNSYAQDFGEKQSVLKAQWPRVVSMKPVNGAKNVDPGLRSIEVIFDRPMRDNSWSLVGGGPHCPETTGRPQYDAGRTTWTVSVKLKPDWNYEFMLNSGSFTSFQSAEGVPLEPVSVKFKTGAAAAK